MVALLWLVITVVGEVLVAAWDPLPTAAAEEAEVVDDAFRVLMVLSVPVFAFVVSVLVYAVPRFRRKGEPGEDGPPVHSRRSVVGGWLLITTALTIVVIIFPGITGLMELGRHARDEDMVVQVQGAQFAWVVTYPPSGAVSVTEMVLPVGKRIRFEVSSVDVLHSFWVPAFRMKVDAVPGRVTTTYVTPNRTGTFQDDPTFRLQCAELCGEGHAIMMIPVRVVDPDEFEAWIKERAPGP